MLIAQARACKVTGVGVLSLEFWTSHCGDHDVAATGQRVSDGLSPPNLRPMRAMSCRSSCVVAETARRSGRSGRLREHTNEARGHRSRSAQLTDWCCKELKRFGCSTSFVWCVVHEHGGRRGCVFFSVKHTPHVNRASRVHYTERRVATLPWIRQARDFDADYGTVEWADDVTRSRTSLRGWLEDSKIRLAASTDAAWQYSEASLASSKYAHEYSFECGYYWSRIGHRNGLQRPRFAFYTQPRCECTHGNRCFYWIVMDEIFRGNAEAYSFEDS